MADMETTPSHKNTYFATVIAVLLLALTSIACTPREATMLAAVNAAGGADELTSLERKAWAVLATFDDGHLVTEVVEGPMSRPNIVAEILTNEPTVMRLSPEMATFGDARFRSVVAHELGHVYEFSEWGVKELVAVPAGPGLQYEVWAECYATHHAGRPVVGVAHDVCHCTAAEMAVALPWLRA